MNNLFEYVKAKIEENSKDYPIKSILQCGSSAKGTAVDNSDIDIFVCFDLSYDFQNFETYINYLADKLFTTYNIKFATYPYIETNILNVNNDNILLNIVPCYHTESIEEIKSPVDRTPYHVVWVNSNLSIQQKEDVKKLKEFLKINNLYGADDYTRGFSGYLCEVLIYTYKSFEGFIDKFAYTTENNINKSPYHILDPVDPKRHLSKAVSNENWAKLILCCRKYLGYEDMQKAELDVDVLHSYLKPHLVLVEHKTEDLAKIRKETSKIVNILKKSGFNVFDSDYKPMLSIILVEYKILPYLYKKNKIINIASKDAHINVPKINGKYSIKNVVNDDFTFSSIRYREHKINVNDVLKSNGYKVIKSGIRNYSYKKYLTS